MKSKEFTKKLSLNKETIASLHTTEMKELKGGGLSDNYICTIGSICTAIGQCTYRYC